MHHENYTNHEAVPQNSAPHNELETIKNEILAKMNEGKHKSLPWGSVAVTAILGILTLISVAQMAGSVYIFNKLKSGNLGPSTTSAPQANSPQNAPAMVGGC